MNADLKIAKAVSRLYGRPASSSICSSCQRSISRRTYASAAVAQSPPDSVSQPPPTTSSPYTNGKPTTALSRSLRPTYQLKAGVVLSRPPQITRDLTPFEKSFYLYQRRLNERLALPFTRYFYYKKGTPADVEWKAKIKERLTPARDIGVYNAYGKTGWADEVLVGAKESEVDWQVERLIRDSETTTAEGKPADKGVEGGSVEQQEAQQAQLQKQANVTEVERPAARTTKADQEGNVRSLDRELQRTLYLLVKREGRWIFPSERLVEREDLRSAAERVLTTSAGSNMNTWIVGNAPIGHFTYDFRKTLENTERGSKELGEKVFFMKGRIMGGQANLKENKVGLEDFQWATREQVEKLVTPKYWSMVQDMLGDR